MSGGPAETAQPGWRQTMSWLHTWTGLLLSVVLYFMFVTGTAGYVHLEITRWMEPERAATGAEAVGSSPALAAKAVAQLQADMPRAKAYYITLPAGRHAGELSLYASALEGDAAIERRLDPATFAPLGTVRETGGGGALYAMHYALHYLPGAVAMYLVGIATMFMLIAIITGVVVHKKIFADFFTFRPAKRQRSWLDAHNLSSVLALPFLVMITYSGLLFYTFDYAPAAKWAAYGTGAEANSRIDAEIYPSYASLPITAEPAPLASVADMIAAAEARWGAGSVQYFNIQNPGLANAILTAEREATARSAILPQRLQSNAVTGAMLGDPGVRDPASVQFADVLIFLHEGNFARPVLRWLYVVAGLFGAAMIATGMVLWTAKRRQRLRGDAAASAGLVFVERLNVGVIVGLPLGIAVYFWANRLLPLGMAGRAEWEMHALFITWAGALIAGALRPPGKAWPEQLALAALMFGAIPFLNAATTTIHLGRTLPIVGEGDGVLAAFDLSMLVIGACFAFAARRARGKYPSAASRATGMIAPHPVPAE
jgi:uncharacterized iron-regulated membrane protein